MISFIVPAYNEEDGLARALQAIHASAHAIGADYEVIVVDDASTDGTAEIARQNQAVVLTVHNRQIAATRNAGARIARGNWLFFVDADTQVNVPALTAAWAALKAGAVGGGCLAYFGDSAPFYARLLLIWMGAFMHLGGVSSGAFMFCTKAAFEEVGGFDEKMFGGEDAAMSLALQRVGKFVVPWPRVATSGRRVRAISGLALLLLLLRMAFAPAAMLGRRGAVEKIWYDPDRKETRKKSGAPWVWFSNTAALAIVLLLMGLPLWLVPWPEWLSASPLGAVRHIALILLAHIGLVLWPCAWQLALGLPRAPRFPEKLKILLLVALCLWEGWRSVLGVWGFWQWIIWGQGH